MDLDDLLEDLWEDVMGDARKRAGETRQRIARQARIPGVRRRLRSAALWGSGLWLTTFGGLGVASELAIDGGVGTALAVLLGGIALPALPAGVWAWRSRSRDRSGAREAAARRHVRHERDELPVDVVADWTRLRRAQVLVEDLARQGLVGVDALGEQMAMVGQLRELLVADRRASELGAAPSAELRRQVADTADLLVALAAEAVQHRTAEVGRSQAPATLLQARDRLTTLRSARAEVDAVDDDAARASDFIERERATRAGPGAGAGGAPDDGRGRSGRRRRRGSERDDGQDTPRATPG